MERTKSFSHDSYIKCRLLNFNRGMILSYGSRKESILGQASTAESQKSMLHLANCSWQKRNIEQF